MIDDTVPHAMTLAKDGKFWRSTCACGWWSKLCRSKAAAERSKFFHLGPQVTVTSKRSRTPGLRPPGSRRLATYDSSAAGVLDAKDRITPTKREKAKKDRAEAKVKKEVRAKVAARDGHCRLLQLCFNPYEPHEFGDCASGSEWAHLVSRAKTRKMAPELRHTTQTSVMLCGGPDGGHHYAHDKGTGEKKLKIEALTKRGADGPLRFTLGKLVYEEPNRG